MTSVLRPTFRGWLVLTLWFALRSCAWAATYYVDADAGDDGNSGTSIGAAWRTIPGTRNVAGTSSRQAAWGSITTSNKISCGTDIILKGGTTQDAANDSAGAIAVTSDYYTTTCTTSTRIRFRVGTTTNGLWSGASGPFTTNGAGVTPYGDNAKLCYSDHTGQVAVCNVAFTEWDGGGATARFTSTGSTSYAFVVACNGCSASGFRMDYADLGNAASGFNIGHWSNWQVSNSIAHDTSDCGGWQVGMNNDHAVSAAGFVADEVYATGSPTTQTGCNDAILAGGNTNIWYLDLYVHDNNHRGVNTGCIYGPSCTTASRWKFRNLQSVHNGLACPGANCTGTNFGISWEPTAGTQDALNVVTNSVLYRATYGAEAYGFGNADFWNLTSYLNGNMAIWDVTGGTQRWFNVANKFGSSTNPWTLQNSGGTSDCLDPALRNACLQNPSNSTTFGVNASPCSVPTGTYASPPAWANDASNHLGTACNMAWAADGGTCASGTYTACDFTPTAGSTLIDGGKSFLLANGAGSGNTVTVKANGGSADPRDFFIAPDSFLDANTLASTYRAVQIEGGCGARHVTSLSGSTVTFDGASCSWADNAMVHLPWNGSAPDIGAVEYASGATTTTTSSTTTTTSSSSTTVTTSSTTTSTSSSTTSSTVSAMPTGTALY